MPVAVPGPVPTVQVTVQVTVPVTARRARSNGFMEYKLRAVLQTLLPAPCAGLREPRAGGAAGAEPAPAAFGAFKRALAAQSALASRARVGQNVVQVQHPC